MLIALSRRRLVTARATRITRLHRRLVAVDAARPGDWILVGPGDYKATSRRAPARSPDVPASVLITTPHLTLRGMNRNTVIVDGTRRGATCNAVKADQSFGPRSRHGPQGMNGIEVFRADDVSVEDLTTCNFLAGAGAGAGTGNTGNGVWWSGGADSGRIGGRGFHGAYLTATSTYYDPSHPALGAAYGIYSGNWSGGTWTHAYASNFSDSGFYIGACRQVCDQTIDRAGAQYDAIGFSGSNSGGRLVVANSEFDHNADGADANSQNGDNPPPQDGACPDHGLSPITHTHSCWVFRHNYVHDNNNAGVPAAGASAGVPVGTGISLSGARNDTLLDNRIVGNGAWGTILVPFLDSGPPCTGGTVLGAICLYDESGDAVLNNTYTHQRLLRQPDQRRPRADERRAGTDGLLRREPGHPRPAHDNAVERRAHLPSLHRPDRPAQSPRPAVGRLCRGGHV